MAQTTFSLLLLRRLSSQNPHLHRATRPFILSHHLLTPKHYFSSLSSNPTSTTNPSSDSKPSSLSARMSFVFDQIDAIEKERSQKDETLQRIRAWRESKKHKTNDEIPSSSSRVGFGELDSTESNSAELESGESRREKVGLLNKEVELVHPWPEWIELMERLVQQNYFDHRRKNEDKMVEDLGFEMSEVVDEGFDFTRDWKTVQTACLNFGRDRFDILRSLSRQDIQILVGYGCPSADKKVVFSAKLLRKHVHIDEGDVCSSCSLRSSCERAYLLTNKEDEARTIDVMRILLTYGFDPVNGSVVNESLLKIKSVKTVVRKLLHEVVKLSAVPIDPNLPPPVIKKPPPKVKQPPPPPKRRVGRDDIEMKKGDWLCPKCDFMNFAKNTICLQCDARRPKRQLLPGEWECPQCNFLNYRRNMACFHCEHKRPPDEFMENQMEQRQRGPGMSSGKIVPSRAEISNAWNFDFDDDESDGADVAAFEYADSQRMLEDFPPDTRSQGENFRAPEDSFSTNSRTPRAHEREFSDAGPRKPGTGFNDFDDEEDDDDVESYELDTQNNNHGQKSSSLDFSDVEGYSESEDVEGLDDNRVPHRNRSFSRGTKPSKPIRRTEAFSGSEDDNELDFDSDEDLPVDRSLKSSHFADSKQRTRGRGATSFDSDEDLADANFGSRKNKENKRDFCRSHLKRRGNPDSEDSDLDSDDDDDFHTHKHGPRGNKAGPGRRENTSKGRREFDFVEDSRSRSSGVKGDGRKPFRDDFNDRSSGGSRGNSRGFERDDFNDRSSWGSCGKSRGFQRDDFNDRSSRGSRGNSRVFERDDYGGSRMKDREGGFRNSRGPKREGFGKRQGGRFSNSDSRSDANRDFEDERPRRPRVNVR